MGEVGTAVQRISYAAVGGLPLLAVAYTLFLVWIDPLSVESGGWVRVAATLIFLEFLLLHSGAFMSVGPTVFGKWWQRLGWFMGFGLVYGIALVGFSKWSESDYVFWVLLSVVTSRLLTLVITADKRGTILMLQRSTLGTFIWILTALACFLPVPELGITEAIRDASFGVDADDLLARYPQRFIAWGALHFMLMGLLEIFVGWRLPDWSDEEVEKTWEVMKGGTGQG